MLELHGWVTIRETYKVSDNEEENIDIIIEKLKREVEKLSWFKPQINALNGSWFLEFTLFSNRKNPQTQEVFKFYKRIGELAEGSYGLIYLYDDEDERKGNEFQVFSLSRGTVKEFSDSYLSPVIPTIEDRE
ncbi:MAG: immunity 7 family protein [Acetatifactor sp.]|nr:immunity 7 family protein [Acetatifactor sp.]